MRQEFRGCHETVGPYMNRWICDCETDFECWGRLWKACPSDPEVDSEERVTFGKRERGQGSGKGDRSDKSTKAGSRASARGRAEAQNTLCEGARVYWAEHAMGQGSAIPRSGFAVLGLILVVAATEGLALKLAGGGPC